MKNKDDLLVDAEYHLKTVIDTCERLTESLSNLEFTLMNLKLEESLMWFRKGVEKVNSSKEK